MKQVKSILLILLIAVQPLSKVWIVLDFKIHQKEIARTQCVKKNNKKNTCQGKCLLKKKIAKADENEKKQTPTLQKDQVITLFCYILRPFSIYNNPLDLKEAKLQYTYESNFYRSNFLLDVFHPPEYIAG